MYIEPLGQDCTRETSNALGVRYMYTFNVFPKRSQLQFVAHTKLVLTSFFIQRCFPSVHPSWLRNELKSDVFLRQHDQYFMLKSEIRYIGLKNISLG